MTAVGLLLFFLTLLVSGIRIMLASGGGAECFLPSSL